MNIIVATAQESRGENTTDAMDDVQRQIQELMERLENTESTVIRLTDQILKLDETLSAIADYVIPKEDIESND